MKRKAVNVPIQAKAAQPGIDPAMIGAVIFNSAAAYPIFDQLGHDAAMKAANFCSEQSMRQPLDMRDKHGKFPIFDVPGFGPRSSVFCVAIMTAFLVWVYKGKNLPTGPLMSAALDGYRLYSMQKKGA